MKKRITIENLAGMVKRGFDDIGHQFGDAIERLRKEMATKNDLKHFATKEDLKHFATKEDLVDFKDDIIGEVRKENAKVIQSNDKVVTKLDTVIKELAAHDLAHKRIDDTLENHKRRIGKLEGVVGVKS